MRAANRYLIICLATLGLSATALAGEPSAEFNQCMKDADGVVMGIKECYDKEITQLERELKTSYAATLKAASASRKGSLKKAQAAWVKFRAANCDAYTNPEGGQMATLPTYVCEARMLQERIDELKTFNDY